jgi:hypothetical protein
MIYIRRRKISSVIYHKSTKNGGNSTYPLMMQAGGDLGNPDQGKRASRRDKDWKKKQETQAK